MNPPDVTALTVIQYGIIAILYLIVLKYRLPYLKVLAINAALGTIPVIYMATLNRAIVGPHREEPPNMLTIILMLLSGFIIIGIFLFRFSILQTIGLVISNVVVTVIGQLVLGRI